MHMASLGLDIDFKRRGKEDGVTPYRRVEDVVAFL
jgi:hypothetical protein